MTLSVKQSTSLPPCADLDRSSSINGFSSMTLFAESPVPSQCTSAARLLELDLSGRSANLAEPQRPCASLDSVMRFVGVSVLLAASTHRLMRDSDQNMARVFQNSLFASVPLDPRVKGNTCATSSGSPAFVMQHLFKSLVRQFFAASLDRLVNGAVWVLLVGVPVLPSSPASISSALRFLVFPSQARTASAGLFSRAYSAAIGWFSNIAQIFRRGSMSASQRKA
ncbi:hypothetical protein BJX65DRAFT_271763 [Aspergillus insuetus]